MAEGTAQPKNNVPSPDAGHIPITEEMDSAKWTLPPLVPLLIVLVVLAAVVGAAVYLLRPKAGASGDITGVYTAELPDKSNTMVVLHVRISNLGDKPIWMRNFKAQLKTDQGEFSDEAASAVDYNRYFKAFPDLGQHQIAPLRPEARIPPGAQQEGMVLVVFPVSKDAFDKRKSLAVTIENYDRKELVIAEKPEGK